MSALNKTPLLGRSAESGGCPPVWVLHTHMQTTGIPLPLWPGTAQQLLLIARDRTWISTKEINDVSNLKTLSNLRGKC